MLLTLLDFSLWSCKQCFNLIYYLVKGNPQQKLLEDVERKLERLERLLDKPEK